MMVACLTNQPPHVMADIFPVLVIMSMPGIVMVSVGVGMVTLKVELRRRCELRDRASNLTSSLRGRLARLCSSP